MQKSLRPSARNYRARPENSQARPRSWVSVNEYGDWLPDPDSLLAGQTLIETDNEPQNTGLLDAHGNKLYRTSERHRPGFKWGTE